MPSWLTAQELLDSRHVQGLDPNAVTEQFDAVELRIERFLGRSWSSDGSPKTASEQLRGNGSHVLWVTHIPARSLTSLSIDGEIKDTGDFTLWESGRLERDDTTIHLWGRGGIEFPWGSRVEVAYEHGEQTAPPADLLDAALRATATLVAAHANPRQGERTASVELPTGTTIDFTHIPDWDRGRPFGMPDIDMVVTSYGGDGRPVIA